MTEQCPKCGNTDFAIARDMTSRRHCKCGNTWLPDGMGETWKAHRYDEIDHVVEQMGGWANFSYWINRHAANNFGTFMKMELREAKLLEVIKQIQSALEFYGDKFNWRTNSGKIGITPLTNGDDLEIINEKWTGGKRARATLEKTKQMMEELK